MNQLTTSHLSRRRAALVPVVAALVMSLTAASALATIGLGRATSFHSRFSTSHAGVATGLILRTAGRLPSAGITEAPAVRQTVVLPRGTTLRLAALPQCTATLAQLTSEGAEGACPAKSRVGTGGADGVLNGAPVHFDIGIYAVRGQLGFAAERGGRPLKQFFLGVARGRRLVLTAPTLGGTIAPVGFHAQIPPRPGGTLWLRTPRACPASHHWTATGHFQGVSAATPTAHGVTPEQTLVDHVRCHA